VKRLATLGLAASILFGGCGGWDSGPTDADLDKAARSCDELRESLAIMRSDETDTYGPAMIARGEQLLDRCEQAGF